jgi:hypothetical protein
MGWVAPHAIVSVETARGETVEAEGFTTETVRGVGKAALHLLRARA